MMSPDVAEVLARADIRVQALCGTVSSCDERELARKLRKTELLADGRQALAKGAS